MPRTALNTNLSWRKNNWTWFLNGGGGYTESKGKNETETTYTILFFLQFLQTNRQPKDILSYQSRILIRNL
jgi:hypothetical protein